MVPITALIPVIVYFAFWIYVFLLTMKFKKALLKSFPREANQYLSQTTIFGDYSTVGFFYLWDDKIKNLAKKEKKIESLRQHTSKCMIILFTSVFLIPVLTLIILWLAPVIKGLQNGNSLGFVVTGCGTLLDILISLLNSCGKNRDCLLFFLLIKLTEVFECPVLRRRTALQHCDSNLKMPAAYHKQSLCPRKRRDLRLTAPTGVINVGIHKTILSDGIFTAAK